MDTKMKDEAQKKIKEGWIHSVMLIEVLAISEEAAKSALEKHVESLRIEKKTFVYRKDFKEIRKLNNPLPKIEVGYSNVVEIELLTEDFETLVNHAMNYAPSSIEVLHPDKITLEIGEAQGIVVSVADMLHNFAKTGLGGVVVKS